MGCKGKRKKSVKIIVKINRKGENITLLILQQCTSSPMGAEVYKLLFSHQVKKSQSLLEELCIEHSRHRKSIKQLLGHYWEMFFVFHFSF